MNTYELSYDFILDHLASCPALHLGLIARWLDPVGQLGGHDFLNDDELTNAWGILDIARSVDPEVYALAVVQLHQTQDETLAARAVLRHFEAQGLDVTPTEEGYLNWGIPLPALGFNLNEPDELEHNPYLALYRLFGMTEDDLTGGWDVPTMVYDCAQAISNNLLQHPDKRYRCLGFTLQHAFGLSGNTLVDLTYELMCELTPLEWTADDYEFALDLIDEAETIREWASEGFDFLLAQPQVQTQLETHIRTLTRRKALPDDYTPRHLSWPDPGPA